MSEQQKAILVEKQLEKDKYGLYIHADNYDECRANIETSKNRN